MSHDAWKLIIAAALDLLLGDPNIIRHPVRIIGSYITFCENRARRLLPSYPTFAGFLTGASTVFLTFSVVFLSVNLAEKTDPRLGAAIEIIWIYLALSAGDLSKSALKVFFAVKSGNIANARNCLSMIVGRDTRSLDNSEISRASIETVAESLVDGILSPLFFLFIGGAPLMWAYKAVNTCDSMIGHNDEKYRRFGKFSAKLDDFANFAPARIAIPIIFIAAIALKIMAEPFRPLNCVITALKDGRKHASPNSGLPEACFAGALGVKLGGTNYYSGERYNGHVIGKEGRNSNAHDIWNAVKLMWMSFIVAIAIFAVLSK
jgi:adenosylcobinamide-phosphate synthase